MKKITTQIEGENWLNDNFKTDIRKDIKELRIVEKIRNDLWKRLQTEWENKQREERQESWISQIWHIVTWKEEDSEVYEFKLEGDWDLKDFTGLEIITFEYDPNSIPNFINGIKKIEIADCKWLKTFTFVNTIIENFKINDLKFLQKVEISNSNSLKEVILKNNDILEEINFSQCANLQNLILENIPKLKRLNITNTMVDLVLENLPSSLEKIDCQGTKVFQKLINYQGFNYKDWRNNWLSKNNKWANLGNKRVAILSIEVEQNDVTKSKEGEIIEILGKGQKILGPNLKKFEVENLSLDTPKSFEWEKKENEELDIDENVKFMINVPFLNKDWDIKYEELEFDKGLKGRNFDKKNLSGQFFIDSKKGYENENYSHKVTATAEKRELVANCNISVQETDDFSEKKIHKILGHYKSVEVYNLDCNVEVSGHDIKNIK